MYRAAQTATLLGGRGKEEKLFHNVLIVPRVLSPIVACSEGIFRVFMNVVRLSGFIPGHVGFQKVEKSERGRGRRKENACP